MARATAHSPEIFAAHPAATAHPDKQPGHWLLASLGKRILRPGGIELTRQLLLRLSLTAADDVVEFAPGMGATARLTLARQPRSYVGVDRDACVVRQLGQELGQSSVRFVPASAEATGLEAGCASVVYGEAMLSMQTPEQKRRIIAEAFRLLKPGGRYGLHELALLPDNIDERSRKEIEREMSMNIHVGVRPATLAEWVDLLIGVGFEVEWQTRAPMHLLEPKRMVNDEGLTGFLRIVFNALRKPEARRRVLSMRKMFRKHASHLSAVAIVCRKPA